MLDITCSVVIVGSTEKKLLADLCVIILLEFLYSQPLTFKVVCHRCWSLILEIKILDVTLIGRQ